jgi:transcriptional regulator with XRE-family HTH domain
MVFSTLGDKLKFYRRNRNLSQMDLELAINAAFGSISRFENNIISPSRETILRIAKVLDLKPEMTADLMDIRVQNAGSVIQMLNFLLESKTRDEAKEKFCKFVPLILEGVERIEISNPDAPKNQKNAKEIEYRLTSDKGTLIFRPEDTADNKKVLLLLARTFDLILARLKN